LKLRYKHNLSLKIAKLIGISEPDPEILNAYKKTTALQIDMKLQIKILPKETFYAHYGNCAAWNDHCWKTT